MNSIHIDATSDSPKVTLDYENGVIEIEGKSYPGDAFSFYAPVLAWLKEYLSGNGRENSIINIKLPYCNSASSQVLFGFFDIVEESAYKKLEVNWHYSKDDEDSYEDYEDMVHEFPNLNIKAVAY